MCANCRGVTLPEFRVAVLSAVAGGARLAALFGRPGANDRVRLTAVLARDAQGQLSLLETEIDDAYAALTPECPQAHLFERELAEQMGRPAPRAPVAQACALSGRLPSGPGRLGPDLAGPNRARRDRFFFTWKGRKCTRWRSDRCMRA